MNEENQEIIVEDIVQDIPEDNMEAMEDYNESIIVTAHTIDDCYEQLSIISTSLIVLTTAILIAYAHATVKRLFRF